MWIEKRRANSDVGLCNSISWVGMSNFLLNCEICEKCDVREMECAEIEAQRSIRGTDLNWILFRGYFAHSVQLKMALAVLNNFFETKLFRTSSEWQWTWYRQMEARLAEYSHRNRRRLKRMRRERKTVWNCYSLSLLPSILNVSLGIWISSDDSGSMSAPLTGNKRSCFRFARGRTYFPATLSKLFLPCSLDSIRCRVSSFVYVYLLNLMSKEPTKKGTWAVGRGKRRRNKQKIQIIIVVVLRFFRFFTRSFHDNDYYDSTRFPRKRTFLVSLFSERKLNFWIYSLGKVRMEFHFWNWILNFGTKTENIYAISFRRRSPKDQSIWGRVLRKIWKNGGCGRILWVAEGDQDMPIIAARGK